MVSNTVVITGASGLLGRKIYNTFSQSGKFNKIVGCAYSRVKNSLIKVDLTNYTEIKKIFDSYNPKVIIHCAAERFPDRAEANTDKTLKLNIECTKNLATLCKEYGARLIYISTNYVFDGTKPPYIPSDKPNPLNFYGETKYGGEKEIQKLDFDYFIVRLPALYGEVEYNGESVITNLIDIVKNKGNTVVIDNYLPIYPTYVGDVAKLCLALAEDHPNRIESKIVHCSSQTKLTEYKICEILGEILDLNIDHIQPKGKDANPNYNGAKIPENPHISIEENFKYKPLAIQYQDLKEYFKSNLKLK